MKETDFCVFDLENETYFYFDACDSFCRFQASLYRALARSMMIPAVLPSLTRTYFVSQGTLVQRCYQIMHATFLQNGGRRESFEVKKYLLFRYFASRFGRLLLSFTLILCYRVRGPCGKIFKQRTERSLTNDILAAYRELKVFPRGHVYFTRTKI